MRNKTTAALLAFFLGAFGGQYFYLGRIGAGIASILFFWTLIPSLIALYHFIKFLTMSDEAFNLEYNREYLAALNSNQLAAPVPAAPTMSRTTTSQPAAPAPSLSLTEELERLFSLKEKGALTEEEFLVRKAKLLA